ncbi:PEP-CTERM sorting domain-containing protein [Aquabacterium sp. OR-4]|uniref:PEP-CTERM sorting domain-containing protein n=1 Tax=Aquabacterium sp. OR-4 TaxID=2978127 RepID=UPI0021B3CFE5|nr:PEP-CTERM sorting domain-containing protein [Aquabacterium sp. OR-4]MDT7837822.1 PEP-CTERM sorting domain-containing protein [Aquabacterium sp. OR-4]
MSNPSSRATSRQLLLSRAVQAAALSTGLLAGQLASAAAPVTAMTQLNVYRDGSSADWVLGNSRWLGDGFDNGNLLVGPAFTGTATAASYQLLGVAAGADPALAAQESGSALRLDATQGDVASNALGAQGRSVRLRLLTNTSDPASGFAQSRSFAASLRLSLDSLPALGHTAGLRFADGFSNSNDYVELFVTGQTGGGAQVVLRKQDFALGAITVIGAATLAPVSGAAQLVLSLAHGAPDSPLLSGSFNFADASGALLSPSFIGLGSATAFNGELHTRLELRATAPVPEPADWALMLAGGGLLLAARRARRGA